MSVCRVLPLAFEGRAWLMTGWAYLQFHGADYLTGLWYGGP